MPGSSPDKKLFIYLEDFLNSDYFAEEILRIREKYKIPKNGYDFNNEKTLDEYKLGGYLFFPKEITQHPSKEWRNIENFYADVNNIFRNTSWHIPVSWTNLSLLSITKDKILYGNKLNKDIEKQYLESLKEELKDENLIKLSDSMNGWPEICMMINSSKQERESIADSFIPDMKKYPVILKISPYASQGDIEKFIKNNWKKIKEKQEIFSSKKPTKLGKIRQRKEKVKKLHKLIWENKNLKIQDLVRKVNNETNYTLGYSDVTKILSQERKRRKQV